MITNIRIAFSLLAVLLLAASCSTQHTAHSTSMAGSESTVRIVRDSVFVCDSVLLQQRADTVFLTRTRTLYRDRLRVDTFWRCDTVISFKERVLVQKKSDGKLCLLLLFTLFLLLLFKSRKNSSKIQIT